MSKKKLLPRSCYLCRNTYDRRHLMEGWTALKLADGRWTGTKEIRKICTKCLDPNNAGLLVGARSTVGKTLHALLPLRELRKVV